MPPIHNLLLDHSTITGVTTTPAGDRRMQHVGFRKAVYAVLLLLVSTAAADQMVREGDHKLPSVPGRHVAAYGAIAESGTAAGGAMSGLQAARKAEQAPGRTLQDAKQQQAATATTPDASAKKAPKQDLNKAACDTKALSKSPLP